MVCSGPHQSTLMYSTLSMSGSLLGAGMILIIVIIVQRNIQTEVMTLEFDSYFGATQSLSGEYCFKTFDIDCKFSYQH